MAATLGNRRVAANVPWVVEIAPYSALVAGQLVTHTWQDTSVDVAPDLVLFAVSTRPTSGSLVTMNWEGSTASSNQVSLRFDTETGGDLTGGVVQVYLIWFNQGAGGIS